jgi:hypothetical protein
MTHYAHTIAPIPSFSISTDSAWIARSIAASHVVTRYDTPDHPVLEVALLHIGNVMSKAADAYPLGFDNLWVAIARVPGSNTPLCAYEFYAGPADLCDFSQTGALLQGKMIVVDSGHHGEGLAPGLLEALYWREVKIAPGPDSTPDGAKLLNKLAACGVTIPAAGAITDPWPI